MFKRIVGMVMVLVLLLAMVPAQAIPAQAAEGGAVITLSGSTGGNGWNQQNNGFRSVWVVVNDTPYQTNNSSVIVDGSGNAVLFTSGEYEIYYATKGGSNARYGSVTVADTSDVTVEMERGTFSSAKMRYAKAIYYNATSFDHLDIRVAGSYVMELGGKEYAATVSNPSVVVNINGTQKYTGNWTGTTSYEWRKTNITLNRADFIEVVLTLDLTYTGANGEEVTIEDATIVYDNVNDIQAFVEAIAICDQYQGLDFTVDVEDIQEVVEEHIVTYEWRVVDQNGQYIDVPMSILEPDDPGTYDTNQEHTLDTYFTPGTSYADYEAGKLYTFQGWETYSHSPEFSIDDTATGYNGIDEGDTAIPITDDTYIYGIWTVSDLPVASAYITVGKVFQVDTDGDGDIDLTTTDASKLPASLAAAGGLWFQVGTGYDADGDGESRVDVDYPMIQAAGGAYKLAVYQYTTPFTVTENQADVAGWKRVTTVGLSDNVHTYSDGTTQTTGTLTWSASNPEKASLALSSVYSDTAVKLGALTYTNTYTKLIGEPVTVMPTLSILKTAADTYTDQAGAVFKLYDASGKEVRTLTTGSDGRASIDFTGLAAGTYTLKETEAPAGYKVNPTVTTVRLEAGTPVEQLISGKFVQVTTYTATVTVDPQGSGVAYNESFQRIHYYNQPVLGSLQVVKNTTGLAADADMKATLVLHGPVKRDSAGKITDEGARHELVITAANTAAAPVILKDLPLGEYLLRETSADVYGYTWDGGKYEIGGTAMTVETYNGVEHCLLTVTNDTPITLNITNGYTVWTSAELVIRKNSPEGLPLAGAEFTLYADGACTQVLGTKTTDATGYVRYSGFTVPEGDTDGIVEYYLKETKAPAGYLLSDAVYKVEIKAVTENGVTKYDTKVTGSSAIAFDRASNTLTVVNQPVTGSLTITKKVEVSNFDEELPVGLVQLTVRVAGPNYTRDVYLNAANGWTVTLEDLPLGSYSVREVDGSLPGYDLVTAYTVDGTAVDSAVAVLAEPAPGVTRAAAVIRSEVGITNTYTRRTETFDLPSSIQVLKVDEAGTPLAGATFRLSRPSHNYYIEFTTGQDGLVTFNMLTGSISEAGIPLDGVFILEETKAPEGFQVSGEKWTVTVKEDDGELDIRLNKEQNIFQGFWQWVSGAQGAVINKDILLLTVPNTRLEKKLTVTKTVEHWQDDRLLDAAPEIGYEPTSYSFTLTVTDTLGKVFKTESFKLKDGESRSFTGIPYGYSYTVTEEVPAGAKFLPAEAAVSGTVGLEDVTLPMINRYYYTVQPGSFTAYKVDAETGKTLPGAEYTLYSDKACTEKVTSAVSGDDGSFQMELPLESATYYLKETKAPTGYHLSDAVFTVEAELAVETSTSGTPVTFVSLEITSDLKKVEKLGLVVEDPAIKELTVSVEKKWVAAEGVTNPESVSVTLLRNGEAYETVTLSAANSWKHSWSVTDEYTWTVDETEVPKGYAKKVEQKDLHFTVTNYHSDIPLTGDLNTLGLWLGMMLLSTTGIFFAGRKLRRKDN